jgi:hypothetical protein
VLVLVLVLVLVVLVAGYRAEVRRDGMGMG